MSQLKERSLLNVSPDSKPCSFSGWVAVVLKDRFGRFSNRFLLFLENVRFKRALLIFVLSFVSLVMNDTRTSSLIWGSSVSEISPSDPVKDLKIVKDAS